MRTYLRKSNQNFAQDPISERFFSIYGAFFLIVVTPPYYIKEVYYECFKCVVFLCDWVCDCWSVAQIDGDPSIFELAFVNTDCWNLHTCESFEFEL